MTPAPESLTRLLISKGRTAVQAILDGQFTSVSTNGGKHLISSSMPGKAFSFQVDSDLSKGALINAAQEAIEYLNRHGEEGAERLANGPIRVARARFC